MSLEIKLVVFDWAGTTIDFGSCAPAGAFVRAFAAKGVTVTPAEARGPMGLHKKDHLRAMLQTPAVAAKSLGGIGVPLSLVVFRPELDVLRPGEHNGTFRGNNLGFVAATAALELWRDTALPARIARVAEALSGRLECIVADQPGHGAHVRGRGALLGLAWTAPEIASRVSAAAFERGAIAETCGPRNDVLKLMPPLRKQAFSLGMGAR